MSVPPGHAAFIRAKFLGPVLSLCNGASAIHAERLINQIIVGQAISSAIGFDCVDRHSYSRSNIGIVDSGIAHAGNCLLLRSGHVNSSRATACGQSYSLPLERSSGV